MTQDTARTCLLLEDDFVLRRAMETALKALGVVDVATFAEADDALEYLASNACPACAIVDYRLGRLETSEDVVAELRRLGVPVVIVTGLGDLPAGVEALAGLPVLEKPVSADALRPFLERSAAIG